MVGGGVLQYLQIFTSILEAMASVVIMSISLGITFEYLFYLNQHQIQIEQRREQVRHLAIWLAVVFIFSIIIENIGVISGIIFGRYRYGPVLQPFLGAVPLVIGFAWINTIVPSMALAYKLLKKSDAVNNWLYAGLIAVFMVLFDVVLEQAAIKLDYWTWKDGIVPIQNYVAWFMISLIFARIGIFLKIDRFAFPKVLKHIYFAQLGYFIPVILR
jgi:putative membrane protein